MGILLTQREGMIVGNIAKILGYIMNGIFEILNSIGIQNIGICIIIFTIIIYTLMLPLTIKQQKSSRLMSVMNPELQKIQKKYENKKDQASMLKMQEETKLVYEKYGTSPTGGCLGALIQLPILFALWPVVQNIPAYVNGVKEAYMPLVNQIMGTSGFQSIMEGIGQAKPILINASKYDYSKANTLVDVLYKFQSSTWDTLADKFPALESLVYETKASAAHFNNFLGINIGETPSNMFSSAMKDFSIGIMVVAIAIPVLAGFTQWLSVKLSQKSTQSASGDNAVTQQMNTMMTIMPLFSVFMCFTLPAGLGIYWITSAVVRTVQQIVINKHLDKKPLDELIKENMEKAAKKREKRNAVQGNVINDMAQKNTKSIQEPKKKQVTSNNNVDSYKKNAKPGSLAAKANMVSDFNRDKK